MVVAEQGPSLWRTLAGLSTIGVTLAAAIGIGSIIGYLLDRWLGTSPYLFLLFFIFGVAAGFLNLFRDIERIKKYL